MKEKLSYRFIIAVSIISVLLGSFLGYSFAQSQTTFTISSGVYPGAPTYTVFKEGSTYYAKNAYGYIAYSGANATTIINNALSGLTSGRTWQETVMLIGTFNLGNSMIVLPSYAILDLYNAKIIVADSNAIQAEGTEITNIHYVSVIGGHIIGANLGIWAGIFFNYVDHFLISDVEVENVAHMGILLYHVQWGIVQNCNPHDNGYDGIAISGGDSDSKDVLISGNTCTGNGQDGIFVDDDSTDISGGIRIVNNYVDGNGDYLMGSRLDNILVGKGNHGVIIANNRVIDGYADGIALTESNNSTIIGNIITLNGNDGFGSGITLAGCSNCTIIGNTISRNDEHGIWIVYSTTPIQSTWNIVTGNTVSYNYSYDLKIQAGSSKNVITSCNFGIINDVGTDTQINLCYNGTTWIP